MAQELKQNAVFTYAPAEKLLDAVNLQLLAELKQDPRLTMVELGRRIGMSSPAVSERVKRMEEAGIIRGYRIEINPSALGLPISAYVRIRPHSGQLAKIIELATQIPEVIECHRVTGDDCFVLKVLIPEMEQLDRLLDRFLQYGLTTTSIIQSSPVLPRTPPLP